VHITFIRVVRTRGHVFNLTTCNCSSN